MPTKKSSKGNKTKKVKKANKKRSVSRSVMGRLLPPVDIQNENQLNELTKRISAGPLTLVFVYADWCGHCQSYKPKMAELEAMPDRTIQTARVRDTVFPKSSLNSAKIEGYPTLMLVKKNGEATAFQTTDGTVTNAIPNHTDMTQMKAIVKNSGTPQGLNLVTHPEPIKNMTTLNKSLQTVSSELEEPVETTILSPSTLNNMKNKTQKTTNASTLTMKPLTTVGSTLLKTTPNTPRVNMPSSIVADQLPSNALNESLLKSNNALVQASTAPITSMNSTTVRQAGGSLWSQLMLASNKVAPAAALFLGSVAMSKKRKSMTKRRSRKN